MLFNSFQFFLFFVLVYSLYRILNHKFQNRMLLVASYVFYGSWDWRFLSLIWLSTIVDYFLALQMDRENDLRKRKFLLVLSICFNLGLLGFFKYFNFFASNLESLASTWGWHFDPVTLQIVLPVGISFYTFQTLSYVIDVYRRQLKAETNLWDYALYVAFFPQLVAGPIERAKNLLPQITQERKINLQQSYEGFWLIFWGLFKKVFVADNLAKIVNEIFSKTGTFSGAAAWVGIYAFAFQIYGDFSGYSDMARGLAKLMGVELMINFKFPYFVTNPRDFWKNWHISLSSWLRDYLYIPLGGNRKGEFRTFCNLLITMFIGGLWHGAAWTFVLWGLYQGGVLAVHRLLEPGFQKIDLKGSFTNSLWLILRVFFMFQITCFGWLIFRSESFEQMINILRNIVFHWDLEGGEAIRLSIRILQIIWLLVTVELFQKLKNEILIVFRWSALARAALYAVVFYYVILYGTNAQEFIYFQF